MWVGTCRRNGKKASEYFRKGFSLKAVDGRITGSDFATCRQKKLTRPASFFPAAQGSSVPLIYARLFTVQTAKSGANDWYMRPGGIGKASRTNVKMKRRLSGNSENRLSYIQSKNRF
jgi:hypothetical protein